MEDNAHGRTPLPRVPGASPDKRGAEIWSSSWANGIPTSYPGATAGGPKAQSPPHPGAPKGKSRYTGAKNLEFPPGQRDTAIQAASQPARPPGNYAARQPGSQAARQLASQPASQPGSQPSSQPASHPASQASQPASQQPAASQPTSQQPAGQPIKG